MTFETIAQSDEKTWPDKKDIEKNKDKDKDKVLRLVTFERFVHTDEETNAILGMFICSKRASFLTSQKVSSIPFGKLAKKILFYFPFDNIIPG